MKPENDSETPMARIVRQGASAFWDDKTLFDNPYPDGSQKQKAWACGWHEAKLELNLNATKREE